MRIGFVGYSTQKFDEKAAEDLFFEALEEIGDLIGEASEEIVFVSGLTNLGVPKLVYELSALVFEGHAKTMGIACKKAFDYEQFPCDRVIIVGENWGDESMTFLAAIDVLIRIGGGEQSKAECAKARELGIRVVERELDAIA